MPTILTKLRTDESLDAILSFYQSVGYEGGANDQDQIFLTYDGSDLVGAVRISSESDSLVLRGMFISESHRNRGIGSDVLEKIRDYLDCQNKPCFCVPHAHLNRFYAQIGFEKLSFESAPKFLTDRAQRYTEQGYDVILMKRESV